ncbi:MAG: trypsin-like serine protease [Acidobacteria bacterium]|nr:trypsin-like serine protease [Acidobacteriota bacterium]MYE94523.1 trypsin-like serine protease [Gemmatimonadota bacterium]MYJ12208.1 trypsin-like serine protease [Gemmatimonadota bacterium]
MILRKDTDWENYPFVVKLLDDDDAPYTGTIVSRHLVMTAAHCVVRNNGDAVESNRITAHLYDGRVLTGSRMFPVRFPSDHTVQYAFGGDGFQNDVALIQFDDDLYETNTCDLRVRIASHEEERLYTSSATGTVVGFGGQPGVNAKSVKLKQCGAEIGRIHKVEDTNFYHEAVLAVNAPIRSGDSGGPLLIRPMDQWLQIGIVSQGGYDKNNDYHKGVIFGLGVCTRIADRKVHDWIVNKVGLCNLKME